MKLYWPCAETTTRPLWTYDSALSIDDCMKVFRCWKYGYGETLAKAWIDVHENGEKIDTIEIGVDAI